MLYNKDNPLTVIELFAGYGSQHIALERIKNDFPEFDYKVLAIAEIDKIDAYRIKTTLKDGTVKEKPIPKSQKYKMADNSIVVDVLYHIFRCMFIPNQPEHNKRKEPKQLSLFEL